MVAISSSRLVLAVVSAGLFAGGCSNASRSESRHNDAGEAPAGGGGTPATPAEAGVCSGEETTCDPVDFVPILPVAEQVVTCDQGAPLRIAWTQTLRRFACSLPACPAVDARVDAAKGRFWAVAEVREPSPENLLGSFVYGFGVLQFDGSGAEVSAAPSDMRRAVDGPYADSGLTRVIAAGPDGKLRWLAPTPDGTGIELRRYGSDATPQAVHRAVETSLPTFGDAFWTPDGSAVVAYRFADPAGSGAPDARLLPGVAAFDPEGRLRWNQTLLSAAMVADPMIAVSSVSIAGVDDQGNVTLRIAQLRRDEDSESIGTRILRLDDHGNVVWARELPNAPRLLADYLQSAAGVMPDGSTSFLHGIPGGTPAVSFQKLDADGKSVTSLRLDTGISSAAVAFDPNGRAIVANAGTESVDVIVLDPATQSCTSHSLAVASCKVADDGTTRGCGQASIRVGDDGRLAFGVAESVGVAELP